MTSLARDRPGRCPADAATSAGLETDPSARKVFPMHEPTTPPGARADQPAAARVETGTPTAALKADLADQLLRVLLAHTQYWWDETDRLECQAQDSPARREVSLASAALCREQGVATLLLRDAVAREAQVPRALVESIRNLGGATVTVHSGHSGVAEWECRGCGCTSGEYPDAQDAQRSAQRHAALCTYPSAPAGLQYRESVARQDDDRWRCLCGNEPATGGFYPCDRSGTDMEDLPDGRWDGWLNRCADCGRLIESGAGIVLDRVAGR